MKVYAGPAAARRENAAKKAGGPTRDGEAAIGTNTAKPKAKITRGGSAARGTVKPSTKPF